MQQFRGALPAENAEPERIARQRANRSGNIDRSRSGTFTMQLCSPADALPPPSGGHLWAALGEALECGDLDEARALYALLHKRTTSAGGSQ